MLADRFQRHPPPVRQQSCRIGPLTARRAPGQSGRDALRLTAQAEQARHQLDGAFDRLAEQDARCLRPLRREAGGDNAPPVPCHIQPQTALIHTHLPEKSLNNTQKSLY